MDRKPELSSVYTDHVRDVYAFFAYRFGTRSEAEDLTQATFERAVKAWRRYDPQKASPKTWLIAIASNLAIDHMRADRSRRNQPFDEDTDDRVAGDGPGDGSLGVDPALAAALSALGERERTVIALRFGGDLSGAEIAAALDLTLANVQQIQSRSLRKLRAAMDAADDRANR